jgi:hypothetical protein
LQIRAIPQGIAVVCALPGPKTHQFYLFHQASNTTLEGLGIVSLDFGRVAIMDDGALDAYLTATAQD